jgi:hypothetical protein
VDGGDDEVDVVADDRVVDDFAADFPAGSRAVWAGDAERLVLFAGDEATFLADVVAAALAGAGLFRAGEAAVLAVGFFAAAMSVAPPGERERRTLPCDVQFSTGLGD